MSDLRAKWDESPELRRAIKDELRNWAQWSKESRLKAPYDRQPWYTPPRDQRDKAPPPPPSDVGMAEETEDYFALWRLIAKDASRSQHRHLESLILAIRLHYLTSMTGLAKSKILHVSRRKFYRLVDEAEYRYWVIAHA